jgi:hypothetical protein
MNPTMSQVTLIYHRQGFTTLPWFQPAIQYCRDFMGECENTHATTPGKANGDNWFDTMEQELLHAHDPNTKDAERIQSIMESKYCPADLNKIVEECTHLDKTKQRQLLKLLQKFEYLFGGTLGTWKTDQWILSSSIPRLHPFMPKHTQCYTLKKRDLKKK